MAFLRRRRDDTIRIEISMPTLQYRLAQKVSNGRSEVLVRFYSGTSFSQRAKSRIFVPVSAWDSAACALIIPRKITPDAVELSMLQRQLDALRDDIFSHWWHEQYDAGPDWLQSTIDALHGIEIHKPNESQRYQLSQIILMCAESKTLSHDTLRQYKVVSDALSRFESTIHPLYIDTLSVNDMCAFRDFFSRETITRKDGHKEEIVRGSNTISSKFKIINSACKWAVRKKYLAESPFGLEEDNKFVPPTERYGSIVYLTADERDHVAKFANLPENLRIARDVFIFQCHVGCRVSDLFLLRRDNVTADGFLQYVPKKTQNISVDVVRVPLDDAARAIISRYADLMTDNLVPYIHPVIYNRAIHDILHRACINRIVIVQDPKTMRPVNKELWQVASSHLARKTFSMTIFKETHNDRVAASFTGHSPNTKSFGRYAKVDDEMKKEIMKNIRNKSHKS